MYISNTVHNALNLVQTKGWVLTEDFLFLLHTGASRDQEQSDGHLHVPEWHRGHSEDQRHGAQDQVLHRVLCAARKEVSARGVCHSCQAPTREGAENRQPTNANALLI